MDTQRSSSNGGGQGGSGEESPFSDVALDFSDGTVVSPEAEVPREMTPREETPASIPARPAVEAAGYTRVIIRSAVEAAGEPKMSESPAARRRSLEVSVDTARPSSLVLEARKSVRRQLRNVGLMLLLVGGLSGAAKLKLLYDEGRFPELPDISALFHRVFPSSDSPEEVVSEPPSAAQPPREERRQSPFWDTQSPVVRQPESPSSQQVPARPDLSMWRKTAEVLPPKGSPLTSFCTEHITESAPSAAGSVFAQCRNKTAVRIPYCGKNVKIGTVSSETIVVDAPDRNSIRLANPCLTSSDGLYVSDIAGTK